MARTAMHSGVVDQPASAEVCDLQRKDAMHRVCNHSLNYTVVTVQLASIYRMKSAVDDKVAS